MKKIVGLIMVWALVTGAGIIVTSAAVGDVRGSVTDTVAAGFYIEGSGQPDRASAAGGIPPSAAAAPAETVVGPSLDAPSSTTSASSDGTISSSTTVTTAGASTSATTTSTTKAPAATVSTATTTVAPTTTSTTAAPTSIRTYNSVGGSVTVEVGDGTLTLLGAVPNSGFSAEEEERSDPTKVVVEFKSSSHHSSIEVKFDSGKVVSEIEEEPQG